jgi:hypothetical protein
MTEKKSFDRIVGQVAGAIYIDITHRFPEPPLMLVPPLTFKVRKIMEQITDLDLLTKEQKAELARDIQVSIVPMLFSYDIDPNTIAQIAPVIESAAFTALTQAA